MTAPLPKDDPGEIDLAPLLTGLGHELAHAADLLRSYERAVLAHKSVAGASQGGARELQLVDLVIQILEDLGPLGKAIAHHLPPDSRVPVSLVDQLRLDQLRALLGGSALRDRPHSGGQIDVF